MKKAIFIIIMLAGLTAQSQDQKTYVLDTKASVINWIGNYVFNFSEHTGTVHFKEGVLTTTNGNISGGTFVIDMTTISNEEFLKGIGPVEHLRDTDFFNVNKYPEASLVITGIEYFSTENVHRFYADLTIKGVTNSIKFIAEADGSNNTITAKFKIDRQRWGITYNNKFKNDAIADGIGFIVSLQFKDID
ncbi:MAG: YceI family protein [Gilvibacter sp.]